MEYVRRWAAPSDCERYVTELHSHLGVATQAEIAPVRAQVRELARIVDELKASAAPPATSSETGISSPGQN
jgi:hypothetical protein